MMRSKGSVPYDTRFVVVVNDSAKSIYWFRASHNLGVKLLIQSRTNKTSVVSKLELLRTMLYFFSNKYTHHVDW